MTNIKGKIMKSNLLDIFNTNKDKEVNGTWYYPMTGIGFLVSRFGGSNTIKRQEVISKYYLPHVDKINKKELTDEEHKRIDIQSFVHTCIIDWEGVTLDGEDAKYNAEDLVDILIEAEELANLLIAFASNRDSFKDELGN